MDFNTISKCRQVAITAIINTTGFLLMICAAPQWQAISQVLVPLLKRVQQLVIQILQLLASLAYFLVGVLKSFALKLLLVAAVQSENPRILHAVLQAQADSRSSTAPDYNQSLLKALQRPAGPHQVGKTVSTLLSEPAAATSISPDVLQQALRSAVQQQNFAVVRLLLRLPAAKAAVGMVASGGRGILSCAATAPAAQQDHLRALVQDLYAIKPHLQNPRLSAADHGLHVRIEVTMALLQSPAAAGLAYSDLMAAAQRTAPMLALHNQGLHAYKHHAALAITARMVSLIAQQGRSISAVLNLIQHYLGTKGQWQLLLKIMTVRAADMKQATADLAVVTFERETYVYAYNSLAAEQKRLEQVTSSSSTMPGQSGPSDNNPAVPAAAPLPRSSSRVQALCVAVAEGRKCLTEQLLASQMVWPSLALSKHGVEVLMLAIATGDVDMLKLVLAPVATASHAESAFATSITTRAAAKFAQQKLDLAIAASSSGGSEFLTLINASAVAPGAVAWVSGARAAYKAGNQERAVTCIKGMALSHNPSDNIMDDTILEALVARHAGGAYPPPGAFLAAVVESCVGDLQQKADAAAGLRRAVSQGLAHFFVRLAVLRHEVVQMRSTARGGGHVITNPLASKGCKKHGTLKSRTASCV